MENVTWPKIETAVAALAPRLLDDFSRLVLDGALKVARDEPNPLRGNLFASAMREVMTSSISATTACERYCSSGTSHPRLGVRPRTDRMSRSIQQQSQLFIGIGM